MESNKKIEAGTEDNYTRDQGVPIKGSTKGREGTKEMQEDRQKEKKPKGETLSDTLQEKAMISHAR